MLPPSTYQTFFQSPAFQNKWQAYLKAFGTDLDDLFGDDYAKKIRFAEGLELMLENKLHEAYYAHIRHFAADCETNNDRRIYDGLVRRCYNEEEMSSIREGDWVKCALGAKGFLYHRVERRSSDLAVIKNLFSFDLDYCRTNPMDSYFRLELTDLKTYQALTIEEKARIEAFFAEHPEETELTRRHTDRMLVYREAILNNGMQEASLSPFRFYRYTTEKAAFVVNLKDLGTHIQVVYGVTTISDEGSFTQFSEDDDDMKLRHIVTIYGDDDEDKAAHAVLSVFEQYRNLTKDDILDRKKERQKAFLARIHTHLKPLGFTKKASKWTKKLGNDFMLTVDLQKSAFSDTYYFNICVSHGLVSHPVCYVKRLDDKGIYMPKQNTINWQLLSEEEVSELMDYATRSMIQPILQYARSPLEYEKEIRAGCTCDRHKCEVCKIEETLWKLHEAQTEPK